MADIKKVYRVRASVSPTHHNKIWLSSGRVPLYLLTKGDDLINFSVNGKGLVVNCWVEHG